MKVIKNVSEQEIRKILGRPDYQFPHALFAENEHLANNVAIVGLGGSIAYGTNLPHKGDIDIRGLFMEKPDEIVGLKPNPEQVVDTETDTVMYSFNKLLKLLLSCNPNTIELLGCKPEHYFYLNEIGEQLIQNQKIFLSKRCIDSFAGYSRSQLARLENAIARDRLSEEKKAEHVKNSMESSMRDFANRCSLSDYGTAKLYTGKTDDGTPEIFIDMDFKKFPVKDFNSLMNVLTNVHRSYNQLNHRNHKKDEEHLDKHAMHLLRLYYMGIDILEKQEIVTYREKEREFLISVRQGRFRKEDGTYTDEFFDLRAELDKRFQYAQKHTELPDVPDPKTVNEFVYGINKKLILREI